jgi:NhaP-type Na+/H+ or K+/H+ antiporter
MTFIFLGVLIFCAHLFNAWFSRRRIPDVLLLMLIGLVIGPALGLVKPETLGPVASVFTTITLVIILFESGTKLNFNTLLNSIRGTMRLTLINFFVTMIIVAVLGLIIKVDILTSLMLGAILGGTSSAVVIPLVSQLKISQKSSTILILESAFSDVLCIVFAWAFMQAILSGSMNVGRVLGEIISSFILATVIGLIAAILWSYVLDRVRHVKNSILTTPAFVFIVYGLNEWLGFSGAIAALAFGISMANIDSMYNNGTLIKKLFKTEPAKLNETEKQLFSEVVFLLKTFFFIYIGISIKLDQFMPILIGFIITLVLFAMRILIVKISAHKEKSTLPVEDKMFMSGIVPKGLAAAVLATIPLQKGITDGEMIQNIVFAVILFSILFTSILMPVMEKDNAVSRFYKRCLSEKKEPTITELLEE